VILGRERAGVRTTSKNFEVTIRWRPGHGLGSPCGRAPNGLVSAARRGGHGRTGTALACLAVLGGQNPATAVAWVRANCYPYAVETAGQEAFVVSLDT
jgi:hypothetical protein